MTVYVYGNTSQTSDHSVRQLTILPTTTGFDLKKQLLRNHVDTSYVLLYNNKRIDGNICICKQIPNFSSIILCGLGKGGGSEDEYNVSGMKLNFISNASFTFMSLPQVNAYHVVRMLMYFAVLVYLQDATLALTCGTPIDQGETMLLT